MPWCGKPGVWVPSLAVACPRGADDLSPLDNRDAVAGVSLRESSRLVVLVGPFFFGEWSLGFRKGADASCGVRQGDWIVGPTCMLPKRCLEARGAHVLDAIAGARAVAWLRLLLIFPMQTRGFLSRSVELLFRSWRSVVPAKPG